MPVPPVSSEPSEAPAAPTARLTPHPVRARLARVAALVLVVSLAGTACGGQADDTVSPDVDLTQVATGRSGDQATADGTADPAAVRADGGAATSPAAALGGVAAAPPTAAPPTAAPPTVAPAAPAPSSTAAPAAPAPTTGAPAPTEPAPGATPPPTMAVSGAASPAPSPTPTTAAAPVTVSESDLAAGEEQSFVLLNELRGGMSLAALTRDPALDTLAREWSRRMAESGELAHSENPYGENIAFTSNTSLTAAEAAQAFERLWSEDPAHSQNMAGAYAKVGVGVWKSERGWYGTHLYNY